MPDNYNILEPTSAPSGTTTRTVRALDVGSGELAGAAVLVDTSGNALIGVKNRSASLPVTIANEDTLDLARYRVSSFSAATPGGSHTPSLPSGVTNDLVISGSQPVAADFSFTGVKSVLWTIPVVAAGYRNFSILVNWSAAPSGGNATIEYLPTGNHTTTFTQTAGSSHALLMINSEGASYTASATLSAPTFARLQMETGSIATALCRISGLSGISSGTYTITIVRSR